MQRELRLSGSKRFSAIHQSGRGLANGFLVLKTIPNELHNSQFGFLVGKRIGNAVVRNRVKRRLREVIRLTPIRGGRDVILIARKNASRANYHQLKSAAEDLLRRAGLILDAASTFPEPTQHRAWAGPQSRNPEGQVSKESLGLRVIHGGGAGE